jgi:transposase
MDPREAKALEIVARAQITYADGAWWVPSRSTKGRHRVEIKGLFPTCSCPDFELREKPCKHIRAVQLLIEAQRQGEQPAPAVPIPKRPTYGQDWPNYNRAQTHEKDHFYELLFDLCSGVEQPAPKGGEQGGRPRLPLRDMLFACVSKVYSTFSSRRFTSDLRAVQEQGRITSLPNYNTVSRYLGDKELTPILLSFIGQSSVPLAEVESDFAVDSSGFSTVARRQRWFDIKYGTERSEAEWVKVHLVTGVRTNTVTAVEILDKHAADSPRLPSLVRATAKGFKIAQVSADKAYAGTENFRAIVDCGGAPYIPFKRNTTGGVGGLFENLYHEFCLHREAFLKSYHKRSNIESTFAMIKAKFGDAVRSKSDVAMKNEVLCKIVCHNICCLISAMYELGIDPRLGGDGAPPAVLPLVRRN